MTTRRRNVCGLTSKIRRTKRKAYSNWKKTRSTVVNRDNFRCMKCGTSSSLHVHHIIPVAKGGLSIQANLVTLCARCHSSKHKHM